MGDDDFYYGNSSTPRRRSGNPTSSKTVPGPQSYSGILYLGFILLVMIIVTCVMMFRSAQAPKTEAPVRDLEAQDQDLEAPAERRGLHLIGPARKSMRRS